MAERPVLADGDRLVGTGTYVQTTPTGRVMFTPVLNGDFERRAAAVPDLRDTHLVTVSALGSEPAARLLWLLLCNALGIAWHGNGYQS